jgi:hypothetical protein
MTTVGENIKLEAITIMTQGGLRRNYTIISVSLIRYRDLDMEGFEVSARFNRIWLFVLNI